MRRTMPASLLSEDFFRKWNEMCVSETADSVSSISTSRYVPQPIEHRPHYVCNRLFVGGFPPGTTSKQLSSLFSKYGTIISCNVLAQDASKNYGFVTFRDIDSAEAVLNESALKTTVFEIGGCALKIKRAMFRPKKGTCNDEKRSRYRGKHDVVKFYDGVRGMHVIRENVQSCSNLRAFFVPLVQNPVQTRPGAVIPPIPLISGVPLQNCMHPTFPPVMFPGPCCFQPPTSACNPGQWQMPALDMEHMNR